MAVKVAHLFVPSKGITTGFVLYPDSSMSTPFASKVAATTEIELSLHFGAISKDEAEKLRKEVAACSLPDE